MINLQIKRGFKRKVTIPISIETAYISKIYPEIVGALPADIKIVIDQPFLDSSTPEVSFTVYVGGFAEATVYTFNLSGNPKPELDVVFTLNVTEV